MEMLCREFYLAAVSPYFHRGYIGADFEVAFAVEDGTF